MSLENRCQQAAKQLDSSDFLRIVSDDDADGIAAAAILTKALERQNIPFHLTLDRLSPDTYRQLEAHENILLLDQGAGNLNALARHPGEATILDHHQVTGRAPHTLHVNPNLEGLDGTHECCTATLAFLTALKLDPNNIDLAPIALAGMIGDRQHVPHLQGANRTAAQRAIDRNTLTAKRGLPFPPTQPLEQALTTSIDPYLDTLTGNARNTRDFLQDLDIPPGHTPQELTDNQTRRLTSALIAHLLHQGAEPRSCEQIAGTRWTGTLAGRTVQASHLAAMLSAASREELPGLAVALAHGDATSFDQAQRLVDGYNEDLLKGLLKLAKDPPKAKNHIQLFDAVDPDLLGAHCGLGMTYLFNQDKPTIAFKPSNGSWKISARATERLTDAGLDLSIAMADAAEAAGGQGGGHPIAAGAKIPNDGRETFLERLDEIVGEQLAG